MKRCPECRKDYVDDTLLYCLDDGTPLVQGSVSDEPATAILSNGGDFERKRYSDIESRHHGRSESQDHFAIVSALLAGAAA